MSKAFKVGERAIVVGSIHFPEVIGREVTVTGPLGLKKNRQGERWFGYETDYWRDGSRFCPRPHHLKKKPNGDGPLAHDFAEKGSWDKVGWTPNAMDKKVTAPTDKSAVAA